MGLSLAPVNRQYLPRRAPSIKSSVDDPNPARGKLEPGEWMWVAALVGVVPHGVSLSRVVPRTIVGLSTQHVFGMTKGTQKMRWQGCLLQAKPSRQHAMAPGKTRPPSTCFRGGATRFKGLHVPVSLGRGRKFLA